MANKTFISVNSVVRGEVKETASRSLSLSNAEAALERVEAYDASVLDCYPFRHGTDVVCGRSLALGNVMRLGGWRHRGMFEGQNVMGKILMICRNALHLGVDPRIDYGLLRSKEIHLFGLTLTFDEGDGQDKPLVSAA